MNENNIYGFDNINNINNNNNNDDDKYHPVQMIHGIDTTDANVNPRDENFIYLLKSTCCRFLEMKSVIFIVTIIDVVLYFITICYGIEKDPTQLLAPQYSTLDAFGMKINNKIYNGQIWRWFTFGLLHANLMHLMVNVISQLIIGSLIETAIGHKNVLILYICSSIGGGIFSSAINNASGVGASVAIFGLVAAYFGYMIINWYYLDEIQGSTNKYCNLMIMIVFVLINISYGFTNERIDNYGHIGGLIFGFFLSLVLITPFNKNDGLYYKTYIWVKIGVVALCILDIGCICLFYTTNV